MLLQVQIPIRNYSQLCVSNWLEPASVTIRASKSTFPRDEKSLRLVTNSFPSKFNDDTSVGSCHGMTIVCNVPRNSLLYYLASSIQQELNNNPILAPYIGILDPTSLHMTVADLVFSENIEKVKSHYNELYRRLETVMQSAAWTRFAMRIVPELHCGRSIRLNLQPYSQEADEGLKAWRSAVYNTCGDICQPQSNYWFHITLGYVVYPMKNDVALAEAKAFCQAKQPLLAQVSPIVLGPPVLSVFTSMNAFPPYNPL
mgnify:CR=1 FL=1